MSNYNQVMRPDCPVPAGTSVIAYCRDSGHENQERSVAQQMASIREYCKAHGLVLERIYSDDARRSTNTEKRDELNALLQEVRSRFPTMHDRFKRERAQKQRPFGIVLWRSNRLGRDAVESNYLTADFQMRALTVFGLVSSLETGDAALDGILASVQRMHDQRAIDDISTDSKRGLAQLVAMRDIDMSFITHNPNWPTRDGRYLGIMPGPVPTGFRAERIIIGVNRRGEKREVQRLIPDPDKWDAAQLAWQLRSAGASLKSIHNATRLFKSINGYTSFFRNRIYCGDLDYGGNRYESFVPSMISREEFEAEQARISRRAEITPNENHPRSLGSRHLLSGLVQCGFIEQQTHPMHANTIPPRNGRAAWDFYLCSKRKNSRGDSCKMPRINANALNKAVIDFLMEEILTHEQLKAVSLEMSRALLDDASNAKIEMSVCERRLADTHKAIENLIDMIERTGGTEDVHSRLRKRRGEADALANDLLKLQRKINEADVLMLPTDAQITEWLEATRRALIGEDVETARIVVRSLISKIVIQGKKKATVFYTPPFSQLQTRIEGVTHTGFEPVSRP